MSVIAVYLDDTERKRAIEELRVSEARLRAVFDTVPVGIVLAEAPSGRIIGGNAYAEKIFGHPLRFSQDAEHYDEWISFHPDGRRVASHEYPLSRVIRSEAERPETEALYQCGDGRRSWICLIAAPIHDEQGSITGDVVAVLNIDREKWAEAALHELNERLFGKRPVAGDSLPNLLEGMPAERTSTMGLWQRALSGEEFTVVMELGRGEEDPPSYEIRFNPLRNRGGETIGVFQNAVDVTERVRSQGSQRPRRRCASHRSSRPWAS